jgi:hypothetical protein
MPAAAARKAFSAFSVRSGLGDLRIAAFLLIFRLAMAPSFLSVAFSS